MTWTIVLLLLTQLAGVRGAAPAEAYAGAPWFEPGKTYTQNFPDPEILLDGDTYYAYGTSTGGAYLPVMSSKDLQTWTARRAYDPGPPLNADPYFNDALPYPAKWGVERNTTNRMKKEVWAPGVAKIGTLYHAYYTVRTRIDPPRYCISVASSNSPEGPFTDTSSAPLVCDADPAGSIDPDPYVDPDTKRAYLVWKSEGVVGSQPTKTWIRELASGGKTFAAGSSQRELLRTTQAWEGNVTENPSLVKHEGRLYLLYSGNEWASSRYATGYALCETVQGPCTKPRSEPLLASSGDRLGRGGGTLFHDKNGNLRLSHQYWNAPYTSYPDYATCSKAGTCTTQGQRRMETLPLTGTGTGLRVGAPGPLAGPGKHVPLQPTRLLDTRTGNGAVKGSVPAGKSVRLQVTGRGGVPTSGVTAALLNLTITGSHGPGYVQAYPTGKGVPGASSNMNVTRTGETIAVHALVPVGDGGTVTIHTSGGGHLVADITGYHAPASTSTSGRYNALAPGRILDTRKEGGIRTSGSALELQVTGRGGVPAAGVSAVALNVTVTGATTNGHVQVIPTGGSTPIGTSSNLNHTRGQTVANLVVVPVGRDGKVTLVTAGTTHLVVDTAGWYTDQSAPSSSSGLLVPVEPARLLDTRSGARPGDNASVHVTPVGRANVPTSGVAGVMLTVTATQAAGAGHVQALPRDGGTLGTSSTLNMTRAGHTIANSAAAKTGAGGSVTLFTNRSTHLVADVTGYYTQ